MNSFHFPISLRWGPTFRCKLYHATPNTLSQLWPVPILQIRSPKELFLFFMFTHCLKQFLNVKQSTVYISPTLSTLLVSTMSASSSSAIQRFQKKTKTECTQWFLSNLDYKLYAPLFERRSTTTGYRSSSWHSLFHDMSHYKCCRS